MDTALAERKQELRRRMKSALKALSSEQKTQLDAAAMQKLLALPVWQSAGLVLAFLSMPDEINTAVLLAEARAAGKQLAVPRIAGDEIEFVILPADWERWPKDRWQIPIPPAELPALSAAELCRPDSLIIMPGLAFDRAGRRLGRGKGYYDRFLERLERATGQSGASPSMRLPLSCGFCYDLQLVDEVPCSAQDKVCDFVIWG